MPKLHRRTLLAATAGGIAAASAWGRGAQAAAPSGSITVSNWGGDWNERTVRLVEKPLVESQGIRIVHDLGMEPERKAKAVAELRLRRSSVDVMHLNDSDAYQMLHQGVLVPDLDTSKIPNFVNIVPALQKKYFISWLYSGVVILYNPAKIPNPPKSYAELWNADFKGKLGLTTQLYFNYMMMGGLIKGGNMTNAEAGKKNLVELKNLTQPRIYAAHQQMAAALANGEIDIAVNYKARGLQWMHDGLKIETAFPSEGAISICFGAGMPQHSPNPAAAYYYLNAMIDPKAMGELARSSFYAPANTKAELTPDERAKIDFTPEQQAKLNAPDYAYVAKETAGWLEWWSQNIAV